MVLDDGAAALRYHEATKHSELRLRMSGHYLDWGNKPSSFKEYKSIHSIPLPHHFLLPQEQSLKTIRGKSAPVRYHPIDLPTLAEMLFFAGGLTRRMKFGSETYYMRAASATGALYPIELYIVTSKLDGLGSGVYHFNPLGFSLDILREGDYTFELAKMLGEATPSRLAVILTSMAWRNAWKYEARSYRHWFWDGGVIAANILATCSSEALPARIKLGFVDAEVDRLLSLKEQQEATVAVVGIDQGSPKPSHDEATMSPLDHAVKESSTNEETYPIIWETNKASELRSRQDVVEWTRAFKPFATETLGKGPTFTLRSFNEGSPPLGKVILQRGSTRKFAQKPISYQAFSTIIDVSTSLIPLDFLPDHDSLIEFYLIVNDVEELQSGAYHFNRATRSLEQLKQGRLRDVSGYLCLEQLLFSDSSAVFFLMTNLRRVLNDLGNRGYRAAQFEAGVRAGKIYLSSYAQMIGASGSTFYDDAVTEFFSPHAKDMNTMIAVGVGVPAYRARSGKILPQFS